MKAVRHSQCTECSGHNCHIKVIWKLHIKRDGACTCLGRPVARSLPPPIRIVINVRSWASVSLTGRSGRDGPTASDCTRLGWTVHRDMLVSPPSLVAPPTVEAPQRWRYCWRARARADCSPSASSCPGRASLPWPTRVFPPHRPSLAFHPIPDF